MGGHVAPEAKVGATTLAVAAAAVTLLQVLQQSIESFNPRPVISVLIVVAVSFATLAAGVLRQRVSREDQLDAALRLWPPPTMQQADPYRLGVFPPRKSGNGAGAVSVPSASVVADLKEAIRTSESGFILVTGPRRAGKSRAALAAAGEAHPDAVVLAPRDGPALRALLDMDPPVFSRRSRLPKWSHSSRAVLWLDGLNRFLEEIDADLLDDIRARAIPVTIVATIRDGEYATALDGCGAEAEGAKTVAAAADELDLADPPSGAGQARAGRAVRP